MTMTWRGPRTVMQVTPAMLNHIGDVLDVGVLMLDREKIVRGWNRWLEIASGRTAVEVCGLPLTDTFPEFGGSAGERAVDVALKGGTSVLAHRFHQAFLWFPPPPGETAFEVMQQSTRVLPNIDADGEIIGVVVLIEDVTERVARDRELREALRAAEAANKTKSEFLAAMSHELRTPLGGIAGYADLMLDGITGPLSDQQRHHAMRIKSVSRHLLGIVDEILTFARLHAGREEVYFVEIDAVRLARDAVAVVEPALRAKGLDLRVSIPDAPVRLVTDELKARQILINLLGNAVKFVERGHVSVSLRADENAVHFEVADTGPGIAPANQQRVFEPFTQVDASLTRRAMGTGLGLPVSRQLARLLGGDVTLDSQPGVGSTFVVSLPRKPKD